MQTIAFRPDAESTAALSVLTRDGSTNSAAIRRALVAEAQRAAREELLRQAKELTADDHDREEARQVLADMVRLRAR